MPKRWKQNKSNKYNARKVVVDGIEFDSKKESKRYLVLRTMERRGEISDLQMQVTFLLIPNQYKEVVEYSPKQHKEKIKKILLRRKLEYTADFVYTKDGEVIVEDVKGYRGGPAYTIFSIKSKLMLYIHGIDVKEI